MVVCDALTLVGIHGYDKLKFREQSSSYQSLAPFQQSMTLEQLKYNKGLNGSETLTLDEIEMLLDLEDEDNRKGNFVRAYPNKHVSYEHLFEVKRYQNHLVSAYLAASDTVQTQLTQKKHKR